MKRTWENSYQILKKYLKEHNGEYPKKDVIYDNISLGIWVNNQRTIYNNGEKDENGTIKYKSNILTKERIEKLNEIGFEWGKAKRINSDKLWDKKYELLKEYLKEHNGRYPVQEEEYKGFYLGTWVSTQRSIYCNGIILEDGTRKYDRYVLTKERIDKLNEIGFAWKIDKRQKSDDKWENNFNLLLEYLNENDGYLPTQRVMYKGFPIGVWVTIQRTTYNNGVKEEDGSLSYNGCILTKERINKLNSINFRWNGDPLITFDEKWNKNYELLIEYLKENNGKYPRQKEIYKNVKIGVWVSNQRVIYNNGLMEEDGTIRFKRNILTKNQVDKLNKIGFTWSSYSKKDMITKVSNRNKNIIKRKVLYKLKEVLEQSKNELESKEDIESINKKLLKSLTTFE